MYNKILPKTLKFLTFVRTERGFEAMNLKYCGKYFRSPSESVYTAMQTSLQAMEQRQKISAFVN
jgi:hypothetical protein